MIERDPTIIADGIDPNIVTGVRAYGDTGTGEDRRAGFQCYVFHGLDLHHFRSDVLLILSGDLSKATGDFPFNDECRLRGL